MTIPDDRPTGLISRLAATVAPVQDLMDAIAETAVHPDWDEVRRTRPAYYAETLARAAADPWAGWQLEHAPDDRPCPHHGPPSETPPCVEGADRCADCLTLHEAPGILAEVEMILGAARTAGILAETGGGA
jgi:hypothetical protein